MLAVPQNPLLKQFPRRFAPEILLSLPGCRMKCCLNGLTLRRRLVRQLLYGKNGSSRLAKYQVSPKALKWNIGIMENRMETTIVYQGIHWGLYRGNGK